ncbi:MAG: TolC family protein [Parvibaculaceae bacterium]|nr:TolC family protein [Parvibaculaceae bacterium]
MRMKMLLAAMLVLAGCASGPDYSAPAAPAHSGGPLLGATSAAVSTARPENDWWRLYNDPVLDKLVTDALAANTDIRVAVARLERARASLDAARADRLPRTSISAGGGYERMPEMNTLPGQDRDTWVADGGLSVSYELDLFGRVKRSIEAANGDAAAAASDADAVRVVVVADTTRAYVNAAAAAEKLSVARHSLDLLDQSLRVTSRRYDAGRAAKLDVLRIAALRDRQASRIPDIAAERQAALFRLAMLTGRTPRELPAIAASRQMPPILERPIPVGDGTALLERRPDIRAAERRLAADTARIGVATADLYPRITLGGSIGQTSPGLDDLFGGGPLRFMLGPLIDWSFPNQSAARARIAASHADADASLAQFDGTVLKALQETETALSSYAGILDWRRSLQAAREQADAAVRIVRARQREGQVDFLDVLDAERTAAEAESEVAAADGRVADAQIDLFRALGGGWQPEAEIRSAASVTETGTHAPWDKPETNHD